MEKDSKANRLLIVFDIAIISVLSGLGMYTSTVLMDYDPVASLVLGLLMTSLISAFLSLVFNKYYFDSSK